MDYTKIIFVSKENVLLGPMAEWIMKSILMDKSKQIMSRGLVVLMNHGVPCEEQVSEEFHAEQVDETTLVLTMNFTEKVKVLEDYGVTEHVYTLREFVQEEDGKEFDPDVPDPYGSGDEAYEECYLELKDLLYRVKKKLQWN